MIHLPRVALEIKTIGLYNLILQDIHKITKKTRVSEDEILETIQSHPKVLEDYKLINVEYNVSNIHINDINIEDVDAGCKEKAQEINDNLKELREIEKYTLDFENSPILVIIFSIEFVVLFSVQYFITLLHLKEWQWWIYGGFLSSVFLAWWYAKKQKQKFKSYAKIYNKKYEETLKMLEKLETNGCIKKSDLIITECEDHV